MAYMEKRGNIYADCNRIARAKPIYEVDEHLSKEISSSYRLLPTFESTLFDTIYTRHYSLQRNESLKCRWSAYKQNIESRVFAPFQFPDIRDLHFYNCTVRILPEASIHQMEHRKKLIPGPGVDSLGHLPIPQEAMMKRGLPDKLRNVKKVRNTPKNDRK